MAARKLTISTLLSLSRIVLIVPFGYAMFSDCPASRLWAASILVVGVLTDFLDGYLARRLHQVTEIGKIVDPLADKIGLVLMAVILAWQGSVPWWYLIVVVVRDLLILLGGLYIKKRKNIIVQSNCPGKVTVSLIALVLFLSVFSDPSLVGLLQVVLWASLFMMAVSLALYAQRLFIGRNVVRNA